MTHSISGSRECQVYPGGYIPLPGIEALLKELKLAGKESAIKPLVNMDELKDYVKIEVALPGIKREDIFIQADDHLLSIIVLHKNSDELRKKLQIHEFDTDFLERHLLLPGNADTEFICAEYKEGVLSLYIPKSSAPSKANTNPVIVY